MYVENVPNRNSPPAILLRESFRDGGQVRKRTLANISDWPAAQIESLRRVLKGETFPSDGGLNIARSLPHGHVAAVVGTMRKLELPQLIDATRSPDRDLSLAMIAARILDPQSKLATARGLDPETATPIALSRRCNWNRPQQMICTKRWTGYSRDKRASKTDWPKGTCRAGPWCSTM